MTDLKLLESIYNMYYEDYLKKANMRVSTIFVPINLDLIAQKLNSNPTTIHGRLHSHLNRRYNYSKRNSADNSIITLFSYIPDEDSYCINFPYLTGIIADLKNEDKKFKQSIILSIIAVVMSAISIFLKYI